MPLEKILKGVKGSNSTVVGPYNYAARPFMDRAITDQAASYIMKRASTKKPFFLYVPFTEPHTPQLPHPDFANPRRSKFQNVLAEIDANTGRILDALDNASLANNTIVVWASDNGPETMSGVGVDFGGYVLRLHQVCTAVQPASRGTVPWDTLQPLWTRIPGQAVQCWDQGKCAVPIGGYA